MRSLDEFAAAKLGTLATRHLRRRLASTARGDGLWVERNGRRLLSFSCNDYLGLSQHRAVREAAIAAIERYGTGAGASRLVTGNHPLYRALEARLASFKGTQAACVFGSGYLANAGTIPALIGAEDLALVDEHAHASIWTGLKLSGATILRFRHNDAGQAEDLLAQHRGQHAHALIATEGVFSMDGDLAPLPALAALAARNDAWLLSDDAHGIGVLGDGHGTGFAAGEAPQIPLQIGTLSKALGSYGGYLCASEAVIELIRNRARSFVYSTGLPPASIAAALAALDIIAQEPALAALPLEKARRFTALAGLAAAHSAIVPILIGDAEAALEASRLLESEGFLAVAIRPPTVPEGTARLRLAFSALHPDGEIDRLAAIIRQRILK